MSGLLNKLQANICLLAVTICWSFEVVLLSILPEGINPFAMTCTTSLIGAMFLVLCFARRIASAIRSDGSKIVRRIAFLSLLSASYNVLIEMGLDYFDVSTGAFTMSMVVVILPVMLLVMRRGVTARTWISALLVLIGVVIATLPVYKTIHPMGLATILSSCILRALFIVKLSDYAQDHDPITLAAGISSFKAVFTFVPWFIMHPSTFLGLPWSPDLIAVFVIYSYFIVAFATVLNAFGQRRASPAQATIIFATEIVFTITWAACLPNYIVGYVEITPFVIAGCAFIVLGNVVEALPAWRESESEADEDMTDAAWNSFVAKSGSSASKTSLFHSSSADLVTQILARLNSPMARKVALFLILLAIYLVISLPFKVLSIIPGFSDLRPVCMLQPVYGIFFGIPGCLAFAVGNVISDILSDSLRWTSIAGFIGNFAFPYLMYLYWTKIRKKPFHLRTGRMVIKMIISIVCCALVESLIICPAVAFVYPEVDIALFTATVLTNLTVFSIVFAIPFIILIQEELGFTPLSPKQSEVESSTV